MAEATTGADAEVDIGKRLSEGNQRGRRIGVLAESTHVALLFPDVAGYTVTGKSEASSIAGNQFIVGCGSAGKEEKNGSAKRLQQVASTPENAADKSR